MIGQNPAASAADDRDGQRRWSIGELAQQTGLTIRALYYYDEIGLVSASERTGSGHRRYTEADLRRLYRVRALRQLGLSLAEVAAVLDRSADEPGMLRDVLVAQLAELDRRARRIGRLRQQISGLVARFDDAGMPDPDQFLTTLEMISMTDRHFTPEQQERLVRRRDELGQTAVDALKSEWIALAGKLRKHQQDGVSVADPRVQALTERWDEIGATFHDGDPQLTAAADAMWQAHAAKFSADISGKLGWPGADDMADLVAYVQAARQARQGA